ncbi:MAG: PAS domain S-box protein, partial [bacterium]
MAKLQSDSTAKLIENEYKQFLASLPYPYAIFVNRKLTVTNDTFRNLFPWIGTASPSLSAFFGRKNSEVVKQLTALLENPSDENPVRNKEVLIPAGDKNNVAAEFSASAIQYDGKPAIYCTFVDVSKRRQVLDQAESTEQRFKVLLDSSLEAISVTQNDHFTLVNTAFLRMLGYDSGLELIGKEFTSVISGRNARSEILEIIRKHMETPDGASFRSEYTGIRKDGAKIQVQMQSSIITLDGIPTLLSYHKDVTTDLKDRDEYQRKIKGLEILNRVADEVLEAKSVDEMYQRGMNAAMKILGFEVAASFSVDKTSSSLG